jgi:predicted hydrocarbon binding protein
MSDDDKKDFEETPEKSGPVLDTVKKLFSVGLSAAFLTEESIRQYLGDIKLPKDALNFILQNANKGKEELVSRVSKEIGSLLGKVDIVKEASRFVETHKFKVTAEIEVKKKDS